jgi:NAD(P)-dependent dehydrogenase (short-subunit alcohol dehydrogenase family)
MAIVQITGGPTGIGRATALAFANEGDQIVAMATRAELAQELRALGAEAELICANVRHDG